MAKNRKHQSAAIRFGPALKAFLLCLLIGGAGIGFVWQKNQIYLLGQQISKRETRLKDLHDQNKKLQQQLGYMNSQKYLEERIKELNLGLVRPQRSQVWYMKEPTSEPNKLERDRQLASRQAAANAINE